MPLLILILLGLAGVPAARADQPAVLTWGRFETDAEVAQWTPLGTRFERSSRFATEGKSAGLIHFRRYAGQQGEDQWPRVTAFGKSGLFPTDWTPWAAVALDLTTNAPEGAQLSVEIRDNEAKNGWYAPYRIQPGMPLRLVIPLSDVAKRINVSHVAEFLLFMGRPPTDINVTVDNVRLIGPSVFTMQQATGTAADAVDSLWPHNPGRAQCRAELEALSRSGDDPGLTAEAAAALAERARQLARKAEGLRIRPLRAFDFGPAGSPLRPGFTGVTAAARYTPEAGFGWRSIEGLKEVSAPAQREWSVSYALNREVPPNVFLNGLNQDLVGGTGPAEFVARVPPGEYAVWLLAGFTSGHEPVVCNFSVDAGAGPFRIGLPQQSIFESRFVRGKATQDGLSIRFSPETGFVVNALAIFPLKDLRRARREFAGSIEREITLAPPDLWAEWRPVAHAPEQPAPKPSTDEERRGCVLFTRAGTQNIYPDSRPAADERFHILETFATPGEYEPFTFAFQPLRETLGVTVEVGALKGPGSRLIPASCVDARQVRCWPVRTSYGTRGTYKVVPEIFDPVVPTDLDAGTCHRFWLTVHVPDGARPGIYEGAATVRAENAPAARVPLRLEVLPFRLLRDPTKSFGNYYYSPLDRVPANAAPTVRAAIVRRAEAEARDMREHGMNTVQMGGVSARKADGRWEAVVNLDERIAFLRRFGLWGEAPGAMMGAFFAGSIYRDVTGEDWRKHLIGAKMPPQSYFDAMADVIAQVEKVRLARGWPEFYYYPIDEAADEAVPILAATLAAIKGVPTAKTYATQVFQRPASRPLDDVLDVWCSGTFCKDLAAVDAMRAKGRVFWCYPNFVACSRGVPNSARMTYGFGLWRMGYSCLIPWHYQAPASGSNPFCDFDGTYGDWCLAYPGRDGPIPTERWENIREGIDDGRYLYTLESRIAEAKKAGRDANAVAAGETLLAEIRAAVPVQETYDQEGPWKGPEYVRYRRRLADAILAFRG